MKNNNNNARIFFALLPDAQTTAAIRFHQDQFSPGTGKKVRPENFHITLLFLGNVDHKTVDNLCIDCDSVALSAFDLEILRPGWWQKAGILWLAPGQTPPALLDLHNALNGIAARRNLPREKRDYVPHVTLMRKVTEAPQYPVIKPFRWHAGNFSLMQSLTFPEGVRYDELAAWPLKP